MADAVVGPVVSEACDLLLETGEFGAGSLHLGDAEVDGGGLASDRLPYRSARRLTRPAELDYLSDVVQWQVQRTQAADEAKQQDVGFAEISITGFGSGWWREHP